MSNRPLCAFALNGLLHVSPRLFTAEYGGEEIRIRLFDDVPIRQIVQDPYMPTHWPSDNADDD